MSEGDWAQAVSGMTAVLTRTLAGEKGLRVEGPYADGALEELRHKVNAVLEDSATNAEQFHRINMSMANALTDWFDVLGAVKQGNLDVHATVDYDDDFLDQLGAMLNGTMDTLKAAQEESERRRQELLVQQAKIIRELSTPILQVWDRVLALPIIGGVDSLRAQDMMEALLQRVVDTQARCVIIDLTGVTAMDTKTADYLLKMTRAVTLVGSFAIVTGIGPDVAQTISRMGLEMPGVPTLRDLRAGLRKAFETLKVDPGTAEAKGG